MDSECGIQEGVVQNSSLREQLGLALRSIKWSYAIFWSISSANAGLLVWADGYYNGDIKTRKTVQTAEVNADQIGIQRSEQLRELYESLLAGEANPQSRRPSASLSPEDLTDSEWYYLVCMSFTFNIGQCLPGRTFSKNETIWLCDAHQADSKTFSRSLLAKSASIQTVVCFPCLGGIIELGVTDSVSEDLNLVEHITESYLSIPYSTVAKITNIVSKSARNSAKFDHDMLEADLNPLVEGEEVIVCSPINSSNGFEADQLAADGYLAESIDWEASQVQSWHFIDEDTSNHVHNSVNSSDSISQSYATPSKKSILPREEKLLHNDGLHNIRECTEKETYSLNPQGDDVHYQSVLSTILKSSDQLIMGPHSVSGRRKSSFVSWKKEGLLCSQALRSGTPQRLLKKVLFEVAKLHNGGLMEQVEDSRKSESIWKQEVHDTDKNHVLSERRRREKLNEKFVILNSMVPTNGKADKISILDNTIVYLKDLQRRVQELESREKIVPKTQTPHDAVERTSDNYGMTKRGISKKRLLKKRKARDTYDTEPSYDRSLSSNSLANDVTVSVVDKDIWIAIRLPWREGLFLDIMEVISNLHLESVAIQSTNDEGILRVNVKSKLKESKVASAETIREALQLVIQK